MLEWSLERVTTTIETNRGEFRPIREQLLAHARHTLHATNELDKTCPFVSSTSDAHFVHTCGG